MATLTSPHHVEKPVRVREEAGIVVELQTTILITGITGSTVTARMADAGAALDAGGYAAFSSTTEYTNLRCMSRDLEWLDNETDKCWATLTYKALGFGGFNNAGALTVRGGGSLQQVGTNFDIFGNQIVVAHYYDPSDASSSFAGQTKFVTAEVQQLSPQLELVYEGYLQLSAPILFQQYWTGHINSIWWNGGAAHTWLCTNVEFDQYDPSTSTYRVAMSFQYDYSTWDQLAVYKDPVTGKPPIDLVPGYGTYNAQTQPERNFHAIIPG